MVSLVREKFQIFTSLIGLAQGWFHFSETKFHLPQTSDYLLILKTEVCSSGLNEQYLTIGSDNGLAQTGRQAIIWSNDG